MLTHRPKLPLSLCKGVHCLRACWHTRLSHTSLFLTFCILRASNKSPHSGSRNSSLSVSSELLSNPAPPAAEQRKQVGWWLTHTSSKVRRKRKRMKSTEFTSTASHGFLEVLIKSRVAYTSEQQSDNQGDFFPPLLLQGANRRCTSDIFCSSPQYQQACNLFIAFSVLKSE